MIVFIKEKSWLAKMAARKLHSQQIAMVIKNTVYLWGASREEFMQSPSWLRHEVAHVYQYKKYGLVRFVFAYFFQSIINGYYNNRFEVEARKEENNADILNNITFR